MTGKGAVVHDELIVITGASGNIGRRIAERLLDGHRKVRVVARREGPLRPLAERGAETMTGDLHDAAFLARAFAGAGKVSQTPVGTKVVVTA